MQMLISVATADQGLVLDNVPFSCPREADLATEIGQALAQLATQPGRSLDNCTISLVVPEQADRQIRRFAPQTRVVVADGADFLTIIGHDGAYQSEIDREDTAMQGLYRRLETAVADGVRALITGHHHTSRT